MFILHPFLLVVFSWSPQFFRAELLPQKWQNSPEKYVNIHIPRTGLGKNSPKNDKTHPKKIAAPCGRSQWAPWRARWDWRPAPLRGAPCRRAPGLKRQDFYGDFKGSIWWVSIGLSGIWRSIYNLRNKSGNARTHSIYLFTYNHICIYVYTHNHIYIYPYICIGLYGISIFDWR